MNLNSFGINTSLSLIEGLVVLGDGGFNEGLAVLEGLPVLCDGSSKRSLVTYFEYMTEWYKLFKL
jgi:hypothetical protein